MRSRSSARDLQFLADHDCRGGQAIQLRDLLPPGAVAELLLCDAPERVAGDHGIDIFAAGGGREWKETENQKKEE